MCVNIPQQLLCKWEREGELLWSTALNHCLDKSLSKPTVWGEVVRVPEPAHSVLLSLIISAALKASYKIRTSWWYPYFQMSQKTGFQKEELFHLWLSKLQSVSAAPCPCEMLGWSFHQPIPPFSGDSESQARRDCWIILVLTLVFHELLCFHLLLSAQGTLCLTALPSAGRDPGFTWHCQEFKRFLLYFIACLRV